MLKSRKTMLKNNEFVKSVVLLPWFWSHAHTSWLLLACILQIEHKFWKCYDPMPITVAAWSKAWTVFARSNAGAVGSNPTWGMDVYARLFCVFAVLCVSSGLRTGWSPVQGVLRLCTGLQNLNDNQKAGRNEVSADMLEQPETEPDSHTRVITGDEIWFFEYYPETKKQSEEWNTPQSPRQK
jgi:hypothetical protein